MQPIFDQSSVDKICEVVAEGASQRKACAKAGVQESTFRDWKRARLDVSAQYIRACEERAHHWAEEFMEVADDGSNDWMASNNPDNPGYVENGEAIRRSVLRIDARKWMMARILPKQFGDALKHTGADGEGPVQFVVTRAGSAHKEKP